MNKYIIELLKLQSSVILPGFGSLMISNSKSGKVVFNPHLKFNDGALAKFIAEKEGIDSQEAQNQVAKFVREMEAEIAKGNSFDIFQFGKFSKNAKGDLEFVQEGTIIPDTSKTESKPAAKVDVKPAVKTETPKTESKPVEKTVAKESTSKPKTDALSDQLKSAESSADKTQSEISKQAKNSFKPEEESKTPLKETEKKPVESKPVEKNIPLAEASKKEAGAQEKNSFKPVTESKPEASKPVEKETRKDPEKAAVQPVVDSSKDTSKAADKKQDVKPQKENIKEKFKKDKPQKVKLENPEGKKPKKKKRALIWVIVIILLGGGLTTAWFFKDQINEFLHAGVGEHDSDSTHAETNHHTNDSLVTEEFVEDTLLVETTEETTEEVVEEAHEKPVKEKPVKEKPVVNHSSPGGSYHLIGNSFSSEQNAQNYASSMNSKGYSAQVLGKFDGLYLVSIKSYSSREDAKSGLSSVQSDAPKAWVFKY